MINKAKRQEDGELTDLEQPVDQLLGTFSEIETLHAMPIFYSVVRVETSNHIWAEDVPAAWAT